MKRFHALVSAVLIAALALTASGCSNKNVAARVNGKPIMLSEVDTQVAQLKKQYPQMFSGADGEGRLLDYKRRIIDSLVDQALISQEADKRGLKVEEADVTRQFEQLKGGFPDAAQFQAALKSAGLTEDGLKQRLRTQILQQKFIDSLSASAKPTDAAMRAYYTQNKQQFFQAAAKRASHILFATDDKKTAEQVLAKLRAGADFGPLAKQYSKDPGSAANGGDLGWPTSAYVPEFEKALAKLKVGEMSGLVKSPYGWHIIKVTEERKAKQQTYEDVKSQISDILSQQTKSDAYTKMLDGLRAAAKIEILIPELKQTTESTATPAGK